MRFDCRFVVKTWFTQITKQGFSHSPLAAFILIFCFLDIVSEIIASNPVNWKWIEFCCGAHSSDNIFNKNCHQKIGSFSLFTISCYSHLTGRAGNPGRWKTVFVKAVVSDAIGLFSKEILKNKAMASCRPLSQLANVTGRWSVRTDSDLLNRLKCFSFPKSQ